MMQRQLRRISTTSALTSPTLLSIFTWSTALLIVSSCLGFADADPSVPKGGFLDIGCKGAFDASIFARLDRICDDCYNLYRAPELYTLCKEDCFTSNYFKGCLDVLLLQDEIEKIKTYIKQLHGADPTI